ncbi:MAG: radical SAM protein [Deltaproteobacteria bacterium]|nr:radical SAM protein [Deltaproteobacteria bacterium]
MPEVALPLLRALPADLADRRGERRLLVWGGPAQWLVVDAELSGFLDLLDGTRDLSAAAGEHARRWKRPEAEVRAEVEPLVADLIKRGIVAPAGAPEPAPPVEQLRIANLTCNLTNACNLRCRFCYTRHHRSPEMPVDRLMDRVEEARGLLSPEASFIVLGGEPFLRVGRLFAALERAERIFRPATLLSTNGTLLEDDAVLATLAGHRVEVQVSIDGPTAEEHDAVRGAGVFAQATSAVRRLAAAGVRTIVSMVYTRRSAVRFEPLLDLARSLGAHEARFIPLRRIGAGLACAEDAPDQVAALEGLLEVLARRPELRPLLGRDWFSIQAAICRFSGARSGCGVASKVAFVDADGTVYPCPNHCAPALACGSLERSSLEEILRRSPTMQRLREDCRVERYPACRGCAFRHWCAGECRGEALAVTGDPFAPSPHCASLKEVFRRLLWLVADGDERLGGTASRRGRLIEEELV